MFITLRSNLINITSIEHRYSILTDPKYEKLSSIVIDATILLLFKKINLQNNLLKLIKGENSIFSAVINFIHY